MGHFQLFLYSFLFLYVFFPEKLGKLQQLGKCVLFANYATKHFLFGTQHWHHNGVAKQKKYTAPSTTADAQYAGGIEMILH